MRYQITRSRPVIAGKIQLPASKSISNRLLILDSLASYPGEIRNLSDSDDTRVLKAALSSPDRVIDAGHAGTAMRFLTACLSIGSEEKILTGSDRMQNRPIGPLVDALNKCGADISFLKKKGYPPLKIKGKRIPGGKISIDSSISSQFISALMMIGPSLDEGLIIDLKNEMVSSSYIRLTSNMMRDYNIPVEFRGNRIEIPPVKYSGIVKTVEADWSAASYWYAMVALSGDMKINLQGLGPGSHQGDSVLPELIEPFGVKTRFSDEGIFLKRGESYGSSFEFDFRDNPDLVQTMTVLCGLSGRPFHFRGTQTLKIKETDRILALGREMGKLGIRIDYDKGGKWIRWDGEKRNISGAPVIIKTYQDHRMAMAFAVASVRFPGILIEEPGVVTKSYPSFWSDMERAGFLVTEK